MTTHNRKDTSMQDFYKALPHLAMALVAIAAVTILAIDHILTGGEALGTIAAASGFTLGVTGASGSISAAAATVPDPSPLISAAADQIHSTTPTQSTSPQG